MKFVQKIAQSELPISENVVLGMVEAIFNQRKQMYCDTEINVLSKNFAVILEKHENEQKVKKINKKIFYKLGNGKTKKGITKKQRFIIYQSVFGTNKFAKSICTTNTFRCCC